MICVEGSEEVQTRIYKKVCEVRECVYRSSRGVAGGGGRCSPWGPRGGSYTPPSDQAEALGCLNVWMKRHTGTDDTAGDQTYGLEPLDGFRQLERS